MIAKHLLHPAIPLLVVDDEELDIEALTRALRSAGVSNAVSVAGDGTEALAMLRGVDGRPKHPQPCIVVSDIIMPKTTGLELLQAMRLDRDLATNRCFILTASELESHFLRAVHLGADGYFKKSQLPAFVRRLARYDALNAKFTASGKSAGQLH